MNDNTCTVYLLSNNGLYASKLMIHQSSTDSKDAAMYSALTNNDINHFYFCYPDLTHRHSNIPVNKNEINSNQIFKQYRFTMI